MDLNKTLNITLILLVLIVIGIFLLARSDGQECISNPLVYGANKLSSEETGTFSCLCSFSNAGYEDVYFDDKNISTLMNYYIGQK